MWYQGDLIKIIKSIKKFQFYWTALGNSVMVGIAWCKFSVRTCYHENWNQLLSCHLTQCVDDFVIGHVSTDVTVCLFQHDQ